MAQISTNARVELVSQATIISWEQKDINESIALSFLDPWDCRDYWKVICAVTKKPYVEDLFDIKAESMKSINRKIDEDPEIKAAYINFLLNKVIRSKQPSALQDLRDAFTSNLESQNWSQMIELARFLEKIIMVKNQELILTLLKENWRETFGALEYLPSNFNLATESFKARYLSFWKMNQRCCLLG